jgi:hypothetical protein
VSKESLKDYPHDTAVRNDRESLVSGKTEEMVGLLEDTALKRGKGFAIWSG